MRSVGRGRSDIDWTQVPDIPLEPGERAENLVTVWLTYDEGPAVGKRFSAAGRWTLEREGVAALPLGESRYALRGVPPALANWGDTVRCVRGPEGRRTVDEIVGPSGHRTYRVLVADRDSPLVEDLRHGLERDGGRVINAAGRLWLIDVAPDVSSVQIEQVLEAAKTSGLAKYEDTLEGSELAGAAWRESSASMGVGRRLWHYRMRPLVPLLALGLVLAVGESTIGGWTAAIAAVIVAPLIAVGILRRRRSLRAARGA
jgi:hypothetical protein